ncbi:MAG: glucosaminidase domain-containing protein [Bacilli bacterium]|jgi:hypothetical protein|nr:glucosaminidase domain-containing protein [Bacilli bacterium]
MKIILLFSIIGLIFSNNFKINQDIKHSYIDNQIEISISKYKKDYNIYKKKNYWKNEHKNVIIKKVNKYLNSTMENKGKFIVEYSISKGVDPYLTTAVMLQETGCYWTCSYLTRVCNNVGGNKGGPSCNGGSYKRFDTIEEGMKFAIDKLAGYYKKGLTTAKEINPRYAEDKTWYVKVNNYIKKMKNS